jgi:hypothetical protein
MKFDLTNPERELIHSYFQTSCDTRYNVIFDNIKKNKKFTSKELMMTFILELQDYIQEKNYMGGALPEYKAAMEKILKQIKATGNYPTKEEFIKKALSDLLKNHCENGKEDWVKKEYVGCTTRDLRRFIENA